MADQESIADQLGNLLFGSQLRRFENRVMQRFDELALQIEQLGTASESLNAALETLKKADATIDSIEPEETTTP